MTGMPSRSRSSSSPPLPLKTRLACAALNLITDLSLRRDGTLNRRVFSFLDPPVPADPRPRRGVRSSDVAVDPATNLIWFRLFVPDGGEAGAEPPLPVVVFFHGGGFAFLSAASRAYDAVCRRLARKLRCAVASVEYRRAPEHRCPAPYDDGEAVLRHLDAADLPDLPLLDLSNCFLMGDSAGANIAHHVGRRWARRAGEWRRVRVRGLVVVQPYFGGEGRTEAEERLKGAPIVAVERTDWLWRAFLPEGATRGHWAADSLGEADPAAEEEVRRCREWPSTMVVVGGWDPLQDWQRRHAERLRAMGKEVRVAEYPDAIHAFYIFPEVKDSAAVIDDVRAFIQSHVTKSSATTTSTE